MQRDFDLEERLIDFAAEILTWCDKLPNKFSERHLGQQLSKSATSAALNYGEAQGAQSRADFIHKIQLSLKELRESQICLKILLRRNLVRIDIQPSMNTCSELVAIFTKSVQTAKLKR